MSIGKNGFFTLLCVFGICGDLENLWRPLLHDIWSYHLIALEISIYRMKAIKLKFSYFKRSYSHSFTKKFVIDNDCLIKL